jgi:hypothetical protein
VKEGVKDWQCMVWCHLLIAEFSNMAIV